ncbi:hypothetical protein [Kribbella qitaiheensis]|nr:hypothetical protein [Kribbella qitaiheensis]
MRRSRPAASQRSTPVALVEADAAKPIATNAAPAASAPCTFCEPRIVNS